tara:strand:+ start:5053 stop:6024 length:972 start_codon:yes stop_codon:yes gene_type:complete
MAKVEKTITQVLPDPEKQAYYLGLLDQTKDLVSKPPAGGLPDVKSADLTDTQQTAIDLSKSGIGNFMPYLQSGYTTMGAGLPTFQGGLSLVGQGANLYGMGVGAPSEEMIQGYMNPYQDAVQAEINRAYDIQKSQAQGRATGTPGGPSAFGGSRAAIEGTEIDRNRASALAQSQAQNFMQAQKAAQDELKRAMMAGQGIGQLAATQGALGSAMGTLGGQQAGIGQLMAGLTGDQLNQLMNFGSTEQKTDQAGLEADYQTKMANLYEPYKRIGFYSDILQGLPSGQTTALTSSSPSPSVLNQLVGAGTTALGGYGAMKNLGMIV